MQLTLNRLVELARATPRRGASPRADGSTMADDPLTRDRLARAWADVQGLRFTIYRSFSAFLKTGMPGPEGSIAKLAWGELNQRMAKVATDIEGASATIGAGSPWSVDGGRWQYLQLRSRGNSIEGGTSEILRSIVAERVLGLPKSR
jgi:alkylation response protein AidB-like acyl-CoA dehydrogenase